MKVEKLLTINNQEQDIQEFLIYNELNEIGNAEFVINSNDTADFTKQKVVLKLRINNQAWIDYFIGFVLSQKKITKSFYQLKCKPTFFVLNQEQNFSLRNQTNQKILQEIAKNTGIEIRSNGGWTKEIISDFVFQGTKKQALIELLELQQFKLTFWTKLDNYTLYCGDWTTSPFATQQAIQLTTDQMQLKNDYYCCPIIPNLKTGMQLQFESEQIIIGSILINNANEMKITKHQ